MILRRVVLLSVAVSAIGITGCIDSPENQPKTEPARSSLLNVNFKCLFNIDISQLFCTGKINILDIEIRIFPVPRPPPEQLEILVNDLDDEAALLQTTLNGPTILQSVETVVLQDYLDKFDTDLTRNDVDVCTTLGGALLCR